MNRFPWAEAAKIGFGLLNLSPQEFWQLTPLELRMIAIAFGQDVQGLDRNSFEQLAQKYPDKDEQNG
ncbi:MULTISPECIES: rcc01693 family protein [Alphaproteobacteria]|uniref:Phage tail assembly chaperone n=2 Tax=Alphaproteobacteria TaxID=28211 RepID=A0ABQ5USS1_9HYPH|nr:MULTISPECIES: rcc01693 family protein [Alphaproteobacteria]GLQ17949.1 hypothetical protein GCM10007879_21980 [Maritalea porphyrae]GLQ22122.1 hypothetical protein GCM10007854_30780 [Algimonas porphyrae]